MREDSEPGAWQLHRPAPPSGKVGDSPALGPTLLPAGHITFTPYPFLLSGVGWVGVFLFPLSLSRYNWPRREESCIHWVWVPYSGLCFRGWACLVDTSRRKLPGGRGPDPGVQGGRALQERNGPLRGRTQNEPRRLSRFSPDC